MALPALFHCTLCWATFQAVDVPSAQADDDGNAIAGAVVIVTEFLDGGNLREMWQGREKAGQTLRWDTVTGVFMEIAHALHYLHENGIVHRDIKPDNVLLDTSLRCKLCDFGLARYGDSLTDNDALPMTICGTDEFMAPEVIFGEPYDCRADVYSFGLLMAEVLCKRCPGPSFLNRSPRTRFKLDMDEFHSAVDDASAKAEEAGIGRCPESLKLLVEECLTYEPDDRSTVDEVCACPCVWACMRLSHAFTSCLSSSRCGDRFPCHCDVLTAANPCVFVLGGCRSLTGCLNCTKN